MTCNACLCLWLRPVAYGLCHESVHFKLLCMLTYPSLMLTSARPLPTQPACAHACHGKLRSTRCGGYGVSYIDATRTESTSTVQRLSGKHQVPARCPGWMPWRSDKAKQQHKTPLHSISNVEAASVTHGLQRLRSGTVRIRRTIGAGILVDANTPSTDGNTGATPTSAVPNNHLQVQTERQGGTRLVRTPTAT
eukprot:TRINITY_DN3312_c1_g1_i1.p1 TRINITY_DN3312_c1_g1~~TRINITY_DN3312_c1_g1_i1.p1  ORF type:complete len:193 (-),score=11.35 TRINITY_DN3312_c1_g1_i1:71-649(-)